MTDPAESLAWVRERERHPEERGRWVARWLCHVCARAHIRDIEGKLPGDYWP